MYANPKQGSRAYNETQKAFRSFRVKGKESGWIIQRLLSEASQEAAQEAADNAELKIQFENLLEVKEQMQRIVLGHHKEAAEAVSA